MKTRDAVRLTAVLLALVVLHFVLRPRLGDPRYAPDFVLIALLVLAIRTRPGTGAAAGFVVGLLADAVAPTAFGAGALAGTVVGCLAGWLKAFVVVDNVIVGALFVLAAAWLRDAIRLLAANQLGASGLAWQLVAVAPLAALTTAVAALVVLLLVRGLLAAPVTR